MTDKRILYARKITVACCCIYTARGRNVDDTRLYYGVLYQFGWNCMKARFGYESWEDCS